MLSSQTQQLIGDRLKAVIAAAPRPELEQAMLRVFIAGSVLASLSWSVLRDGAVGPVNKEVLAVTSGFFATSILLTLGILATPRLSAPRRFLGMAVDNAVCTYCLIQMGERGAFVLFVYLFITFGNGFRFGRLYLHACQVMSIAGFSLVYWLSPFWGQHPALGSGYLLGLIFLPLYIGLLTERVKAERAKAEEALKACLERERRGP